MRYAIDPDREILYSGERAMDRLGEVRERGEGRKHQPPKRTLLQRDEDAEDEDERDPDESKTGFFK